MRRVSDEVWSQLDPAESRLSRRTARRLWATAAVLAVAAVGFVGVRASGLVTPDLVAVRTVWQIRGPDDSGPAAARYVVIENRGWSPVRILNVAQGLPSREPAGELARFYPRLLRPGETAYLPVVVPDNDCAAGAAWSVMLLVERVGGTRTVTLQAPAPEPACPG